jgi:hypothetical protein
MKSKYMSKILQFDNHTIFADAAEEVATLRSPSTAGSSVSLTLDNNHGLAQNDYVLVEDIATARAEIAKINAAVTAGTSIQVDELLFPHNTGVKIYRLKYDQVKFFHAATVGGSKTLLGAVDIDADDQFTEYVDASNTSGYAFFALYNSTTTDQSSYSSAYPYSLLTLTAKSKIREFVKKFYKREWDDDTFGFLADMAESEIYAIRMWRFREKTFTFNTVANQQEYTFDSISLTDYGTLIYATYDGNPLQYVTIKENEILNWGTITSSDVRAIFEWAETFILTPKPDGVKEVKLRYYANAAGFSEETTDTPVSLPQVIAFRILQDLWSMEDLKKSQYWENRYLQGIAVLKTKEKKQSMRFASLTDASLTRRRINNSIDNPSISI